MRKAVISLTLQIKMNLQKTLKTEADKRAQRVKARIVSNLRNNTPVDTGAARDGWRVTEEGITNDVPYVDRLNKGSSRQAPSNFIEQTVLADKDVRVVGAIVQQK